MVNRSFRWSTACGEMAVGGARWELTGALSTRCLLFGRQTNLSLSHYRIDWNETYTYYQWKKGGRKMAGVGINTAPFTEKETCSGSPYKTEKAFGSFSFWNSSMYKEYTLTFTSRLA